jgi:arginase family enzyme
MYGNIKVPLAKGRPINAINFDAHSDFRSLREADTVATAFHAL